MAPRTSSPPPSAYETFDDFDMEQSYFAHPSSSSPASTFATDWRDPATDTTATTTTTTTTTTTATTRRGRPFQQDGGRGNGSKLAALLFQPLKLPRRALNSAAMQALTVVAVYTICIATLWFMFCASFLLTIYDDTRRIVRTSRVWAQVKDGVRERLAMLGEDWEEFAKRYFEQFDHGVDGNKSAPPPGEPHRRNSNPRAPPPPGPNTRVPEPEPNQWWKDAVFRFVANVAGNKFEQTASSFRFRQPTESTSSHR